MHFDERVNKQPGILIFVIIIGMLGWQSNYIWDASDMSEKSSFPYKLLILSYACTRKFVVYTPYSASRVIIHLIKSIVTI